MSYSQYGSCQNFEVPPPLPEFSTNLVIEEIKCDNIKDPSIWGPLAWFFLFAGSCSANNSITRSEAIKYWHFIEGLPLMLPCSMCKEHAQEFVNKRRVNKDEICSTRKNLVKFFVDFHNSVSKRKGSKKLTLREVENRFLRGGPVDAVRIKYY